MYKQNIRFLSKPYIKQFIKFGIVGAIGTLVNIFVLYTFTEIYNIYYIISEVFAFILAGLNNYILNKIWTFKEKIEEDTINKYVKFITISILALTVNISILYILVEFFYIWYIFAEVGAIFGAFFFNFFGNKTWTFKKKEGLTKNEISRSHLIFS